MAVSETDFIAADWPAPNNVRAFCTTRLGGVSETPWDSLNLAGHVEDRADHVAANRSLLADALGLPLANLSFLEQVHETEVVRLPASSRTDAIRADACVTTETNIPCLVMIADCLPVLFCDRSGNRVGAAHAGWRGLASGVLENTVSCFDEPSEVMAWLGPAIGPTSFEVGGEVRDAFMKADPRAEEAFRPSDKPDHFLADLYCLARQRLAHAGVSAIYGGHWCTYSEPNRFYSYRRDGITGRMASLIFLT